MDNVTNVESDLVVSEQHQAGQSVMMAEHCGKSHNNNMMMDKSMQRDHALCFVAVALILIGIVTQIVLQTRILNQLKKGRRK